MRQGAGLGAPAELAFDLVAWRSRASFKVCFLSELAVLMLSAEDVKAVASFYFYVSIFYVLRGRGSAHYAADMGGASHPAWRGEEDDAVVVLNTCVVYFLVLSFYCFCQAA